MTQNHSDPLSKRAIRKVLKTVSFCVILCCFIAITVVTLMKITKEQIRDFTTFHGRLIPKKYELKLIPDIQNLKFSAEINIIFPKTSINTKLQLNMANTIKISGLDESSYTYNETTETLIFDIPQNTDHIAFNYTGTIYNDLYGLYLTNDTSSGTLGLATQFEPEYSRRMMPCIDEPFARSVYKLSIVVPKGYLALANTKPVKIVENEKTSFYEFEDTPYMPSYLICICVGKWEKLVGTTNKGVEVSIYTLPSQKEKPNFALKMAKESLEFFESYTNIDYPLQALQLVAISDFAAGAMENYGLVTFRDYLLSGKEDDKAMMSRAAEVIAHENAHQWTGNLVSPRSWASTWLNEGFASILPHLALESTGYFPWSELYYDTEYRALSFDLSTYTHAVEDDFEDPEMMFDDISYEKGASVLNMLRLLLGDEIFRKCLSVYLNTFRYSATVTEDLVYSFSQTSGVDLKPFFNAWVRTKGSPVLFVSKTDTGMSIKQYRATYDGKFEVATNPWPFKLFISEKDYIQVTKVEETHHQFKYLNHGRKTLVVVKYDDEILEEITENWNNIDNDFKWVILQDLERLIMLNLTKKEKLYNILMKCQNETDILVKSTVNDAAMFILNLYNYDSSMASDFSEMIYPWADKLFQKGKDMSVYETDTLKRLVYFGGHICRSEKFKDLKKYNLLTDDFTILMFDAWNQTTFDELFDRLDTADATTLLAIQKSLASTNNQTNCQRIFAEFGLKIKWQNINTVLNVIIVNKNLRNSAIDYFLNNSKKVADVLGVGFQSESYIKICFSSARNLEELEKIEKTVRSCFKASMDRTINRIKESTLARIRASM